MLVSIAITDRNLKSKSGWQCESEIMSEATETAFGKPKEHTIKVIIPLHIVCVTHKIKRIQDQFISQLLASTTYQDTIISNVPLRSDPRMV